MRFLGEKYAKNAFAAGAPRWGSLQHSPEPLPGFNGPNSKERAGQGRRGKGGGNKVEGEERVIPILFPPLQAMTGPLWRLVLGT